MTFVNTIRLRQNVYMDMSVREKPEEASYCGNTRITIVLRALPIFSIQPPVFRCLLICKRTSWAKERTVM